MDSLVALIFTESSRQKKTVLLQNGETSILQMQHKMTQKYKVPSKHIHPHFTGNDKGLYATMRGGRIDISQNIRQHFRLYATMIGGRIDPSSCLDTCWVDDIT